MIHADNCKVAVTGNAREVLNDYCCVLSAVYNTLAPVGGARKTKKVMRRILEKALSAGEAAVASKEVTED